VHCLAYGLVEKKWQSGQGRGILCVGSSPEKASPTEASIATSHIFI
jgi:hypothetical protein